MKKVNKILLSLVIMVMPICGYISPICLAGKTVAYFKENTIKNPSDSLKPYQQDVTKELNISILRGDVKKVNRILESNAEIDEKYIDSTIRYIRWEPNPYILWSLLAYKNKREHNDTVMCEQDAYSGNYYYECVKLLLKYFHGYKEELKNEGATDEKLDHYLFAVRIDDYEMLDLLDFEDESLILDSCEGETVLTAAVRNNNIEMVKYLLKRGADKEKREFPACYDNAVEGQNAYEIAEELGYKDIMELLK